MPQNPTLDHTASIATRITKSTVAAQYVDHAEKANRSVKPVIALTAITETMLDHGR